MSAGWEAIIGPNYNRTRGGQSLLGTGSQSFRFPGATSLTGFLFSRISIRLAFRACTSHEEIFITFRVVSVDRSLRSATGEEKLSGAARRKAF